MRILFVHPSPLMYSEIYLRLEPLGMERVAAATRAAGHDVRIIDLQIFKHRDLFAELESFRPNAVGFSLNYLANVPEVIDLAKDVKRLMKDCFVFTGGHSGSFVADEILEHADGAIDAVIRGEGETATPMLLDAIGTGSIGKVPGRADDARVGADAGDARRSRQVFSGARSRTPPQQIFYRRARSVRVDRVHPRMPVGLLVLQRVDVLRPQLSQVDAGSRGGRHAVDQRAQRLHRRRRRVHSSRARVCNRPRNRKAQNQKAVLPRDSRRRAVPQSGSVSLLAQARDGVHVPRPRSDRRRRPEAASQAIVDGSQLQGARSRARNRADRC